MSNVNNSQRQWILGKYKLAFPHAQQFIECTVKDSQKKGIDYYALFNENKVLFIEEKVRWKSYPDILIEEYANWEMKILGWGLDITKKSHYLAYIVIPRHEIFIFYYPALRQFFITNHDFLLAKYDREFGETYDYSGRLSYQTSNIPVPLNAFPLDWQAKNIWRY